MRRVIAAAVVLLAACGAPPPATEPDPPPRPIVVEWKVEQGDGDRVDVALVVDGRRIALGALDAATEHEAGTPATCALRAASARRTELVCGDVNAFVADLVGGELHVTQLAGEQRSDVKRIPVDGDSLSVKMLALPFDES